MQIFYLPQPGAAALSGDEARHCVKVLRHRPGDRIWCVDGAGTLYEALILEAAPEQVQLELLARTEGWGEHGRSLTLAFSPLHDKDRLEWMVEKSVELGVTELRPLLCRRTDPYKAKFKPERLHAILLAGLKQTKRSRLPLLHPQEPLEAWLRGPLPEGLRLLAYCEASRPLAAVQEAAAGARSLTWLIGPEGDFTPEEAAAAAQQGFIPLSLGFGRLRSETAGLYALSWVKSCWEF
jgi:16S rRNA (uracil1498-N3)-methyltransferase